MADATPMRFNTLEMVLAAANVIIAVVSIAVALVPGMLAYVG